MNNMRPEKFKEYLDMKDESREQEIKDVFSSLMYKQYSVLVKPSMGEYNGQNSLNYAGTKVYDFSFKKNNDFLIDRLKKYKKKGDDHMQD